MFFSALFVLLGSMLSAFFVAAGWFVVGAGDWQGWVVMAGGLAIVALTVVGMFVRRTDGG